MSVMRPSLQSADLEDLCLNKQSLDENIQSFCSNDFVKITCMSNCSFLIIPGYLRRNKQIERVNCQIKMQTADNECWY